MQSSTQGPPAVQAAGALAVQQEQVATLVARAACGSRWSARLTPDDRARLVEQGHFPDYGAELDWTVGETAGHLRDSALVFAERIRRLQRETRPLLPDFDTTAPDRVAGYRATAPDAMLAQLAEAQRGLREAVLAVDAGELERGGIHESDGPLTLADVLAFLPGHQRDHAAQLAAIVAPAGT